MTFISIRHLQHEYTLSHSNRETKKNLSNINQIVPIAQSDKHNENQQSILFASYMHSSGDMCDAGEIMCNKSRVVLCIDRTNITKKGMHSSRVVVWFRPSLPSPYPRVFWLAFSFDRTARIYTNRVRFHILFRIYIHCAKTAQANSNKARQSKWFIV